MSRLEGKVAIITGAARGQGAATARLFAHEGAKVAITDVLDEPGEALADEIGEASVFLHHDVTSPDAWAEAVRATVGRFGRIDVLVNNAGILRFAPLETMSAEHYMQIVHVNQLGVFLGIKAVVEPMTGAGGGSIVNISSIDGLHGMPYVIAYVSSKFAVTGMTKTAAIELGPRRIRVNSVHPGGIDTPMIDPDSLGEGADPSAFMIPRTPLARLGSPEEVAHVTLFLASDDSSYVTGAAVTVDGGFTAGHTIPRRG